MVDYKEKYFKYKLKYLDLKNQNGGTGEIKYAYMPLMMGHYSQYIGERFFYYYLLTLQEIDNNKNTIKNYKVIDDSCSTTATYKNSGHLYIPYSFKTLYKTNDHTESKWELEIIENRSTSTSHFPVTATICETKLECQNLIDLGLQEEEQRIAIAEAEKKIKVKEITRDDIKDNYGKLYYIPDLNKLQEDMLYCKPLNQQNADTLVVNFAGLDANFYTLFKLSKSHSHIMLFRDKTNNYYYKKLPKIIEYIKKFIKDNDIKKVILFGISMGGYASLYCSNFIDNCICIAMNPQTFPKLKDHDYYIYHDEISVNYTVGHIHDLRKLFTNNSNNSKKYILISHWECETMVNCNRYFHDLVYASYLMGLPNVVLVFVPRVGHNIFPLYDYDNFMKIISEKYDILVNNMNEGKKILNNLEYKKTLPK